MARRAPTSGEPIRMVSAPLDDAFGAALLVERERDGARFVVLPPSVEMSRIRGRMRTVLGCEPPEVWTGCA